MKSWRTTLAGLLGAIATVLLPMITGGGIAPKDLIIAGTVAGIGYLAKDSGVSGVSGKQE